MAHSYRHYLSKLGYLEDYRTKFNEQKLGCTNPKVWSDDDVAKWIWEHTHPIDKTLEFFNSQPVDYQPIPHRFSIGAILFKRSFWSRINGFKAAPEGMLGVEEKDLAKECAASSKVPLLSLNTAAGHLAFGPQKETMIPYYNSNKEMFTL